MSSYWRDALDTKLPTLFASDEERRAARELLEAVLESPARVGGVSAPDAAGTQRAGSGSSACTA